MGEYLNPDGKTYSAVKLFSDLTGLSEEEVRVEIKKIREKKEREKK
jgi:hypothetical protein